MSWLAKLLSPRGAGGTERTGTARAHSAGPARRPGVPAAATKAGRASQPDGKAVYSVQRRVIVSLQQGWKRTTTRKVTKEWRHGNCPIRHQTRRAALRCRNK